MTTAIENYITLTHTPSSSRHITVPIVSICKSDYLELKAAKYYDQWLKQFDCILGKYDYDQTLYGYINSNAFWRIYRKFVSPKTIDFSLTKPWEDYHLFNYIETMNKRDYSFIRKDKETPKMIHRGSSTREKPLYPTCVKHLYG